MGKHIFETSNIFFIYKNNSRHVRVLAICNTQEKFRPYNKYAKKNHKSLSLSFIFLKERKKKKKGGLAGSLAQASDPVGHKRGATLFFCEWRATVQVN
jgi:hypothetical protein